MVSVCMPSDALSQHLPSYLGFSYLGCGIPLHGCSSKVQLLPLTLDEGYLLTATPPDLERGVSPRGLPVTEQPPLLGHGVLNMPANLKKSALATGLEKVSFHSDSKECNTKECSKSLKIALISHAIKVIFNILQGRLQ